MSERKKEKRGIKKLKGKKKVLSSSFRRQIEQIKSFWTLERSGMKEVSCAVATQSFLLIYCCLAIIKAFMWTRKSVVI